jgi:hypothetical protein
MSGKLIRLAVAANERLERHARMLGVIRDHAAAENKSMPIGFAEHAPGAPSREALVRKADGVADGRSEE